MSREADKERALERERAPTSEELEQARQLAARVDGLWSGESAAGEVDSDESATEADLRTAGMIHAAVHGADLSPDRRRAIVTQAIEGAPPARSMLRRSAPSLALAASVLVAIGLTVSFGAMYLGSRPSAKRAPVATLARSAAVDPSSPDLLSRSSDDLLGRPISDVAGASERIDRVFASRLAGYRQLVLSGGSVR